MKKIILTKKTKIYIMAPTNTFTGGPELLHQMATNIKNTFNVHVKMVYLPNIESNPIHKKFKKLKIDYSDHVEDDSNNILIIPEAYMFLKYSLRFTKIKKILWWLSIDNYLGYKFRYDYKKISRSLIKVPFNFISIFNKITNYYFGMIAYHDYLKFLYKRLNLKKQKELIQIDLHLTQSIYASDYIKEYFNNVKYLSDFQRLEILKSKNNNFKYKKNLICYSNKSNEFIESIKKITNLKMIKLSGFNDKQIIKIFKKTKIYLDFGYHPGKDRMPREAVLLDNCVITNRRGSANNNYDIPIKNKYKFKENSKNLIKIKNQIYEIFNNYKNEIKNFRKYKRLILQEKSGFNKDLKNIFIKK